ncbi:MAG TPA: amidohydrolase family protein [Polyangia bacterium]
MIVDAHVHLFPERVFAAIWRWFDAHAWKIRYRMKAEEVIAFLTARGVDRLVGLAYSHAPGMARELNRFLAELGRAHPQLIPLGTVLPGEPDAEAIVDEAFRLGLRGLKLHCHVQKIAADDPRLDPIYARAAQAGLPVVIHSGRAPCLSGYGIDPATLCSAEATRRALRRHPRLKLVVPHLGADEIEAHLAMLDEFEHLHLDTTMAVGGYLDLPLDPAALARHADRILYGTDFPNLPYAWDRELLWLREHLPESAQKTILGENALRLFA